MQTSDVAPTKTEVNLDPFLRPTCGLAMLDNFGVRKQILSAVQAEAPNFYGVLLDVGCGVMPYKSIVTSPPSTVTKYLGVDLADNIHLGKNIDLSWDGLHIPLPDRSVDCAMATEFFEHCPAPELVMKEIARVLRPGGRLFLTVPFLWPLHEVPHDEYRYTPFSLERHLRQAGFCEIKIQPLGGWDAAMAQMVGLWVKNRGFSTRNRWVFSRLALPLIRFLHRLDKRPSRFVNDTMMSGLTASAITSAQAGSGS